MSHNIGPTLYFVIFLDSRAQTAQTDYNDIFGDNPQEIAKIIIICVKIEHLQFQYK